MKNKKKINLFVRTIIFVSVLFLTISVAAISLFYYVFSIPEPEGVSITDWPQRFTNNFSVWTTYENGQLKIEEIGLKRLDEYGLWIQVFDETGEEIFSHNKPAEYPTKYSAPELLAISNSAYQNGYTIFASNIEDTGGLYSYIVGFPYDIGKSEIYYNGERVDSLYIVLNLLIPLSLVVLIILAVAYMLWLSRKLSKVTDGIRGLSKREYSAIKENGVFSEIYAALNKMNSDLKQADKVKEETERTRREWITNITHDLKTPLSPIKGYAELLSNSSIKQTQEIQEYGKVILKNVNHTENLINDLKLTYQLDSGSIPYNLKEVRISRQIKEWVIDIINDPAFADRNIEFESDSPEITSLIDASLFRRAVQNLIINAFVHNSEDTKVRISVSSNQQDTIYISIKDNGRGISEAELPNLFDRYYRGTNTKEKSEGSGLGLAIARQIILLHGGDISVKSKINEGTEFIITLPYST